MDKKLDKRANQLEKLSKVYIPIASVLIALQALAIFQPINFVYAVFVFIMGIISYLLVKDFLPDNQKKIGFGFFLASFVLSIYDLLAVVTKSLNQMTSSSKSMAPLMFLIGVGISIGIAAFFISDDRRQLLLNVYNGSLTAKLGIKGKSEEINEGDAVICKNEEDNEPVVIPFKDRFLHMLVLGPTGCGKTSQILIPLINQDMKNKTCGITVIEPKGDLAEKVYAMGKYYGREAVYFNPVHPDCPYFNPLYGEEADVIENMATTFKMLSASEKSNPFFDNHNENLTRNALKVLKRLKGNEATLVDLSTLIYNSQGMGKKMINSFARLKADTAEIAKENGDIASWFLGEYFNDKSKTYEHCSGMRSQVSKITSNTHLRRVLNPPNGENDVDFEKIIEEGKILAISTAQGELRDLGRYLGYFIILNFQSAVFKRPGNENTRIPHFLYIDEFQTYSNPGFADMLTQGRSYRVASHLATQNRALMAMGSGRDGQNFVELVSTNARNVVIFPGGNSKDAKYYSDEFGEVIEKQVRKSVSKDKFNPLYGFKKIGYPKESISEDEKTVARYSPSDIIFKQFGEVTYRIIKNNSVQIPGVGKVSWISKELNSTLDDMVAEYNKKQDELKHKVKEETEKFHEDLSGIVEVEDIIVSKPKKEPEVNRETKEEIVVISNEREERKVQSQKDEILINIDNDDLDDLI